MSDILALDVGKVKTGIARASTVARLAEPLMTVPTGDVPKTLDELIKKHDVKTVVVGLPRNLNGQETDQTKWVRGWIAGLKPQLPGINFHWQDEALTTQQAAKSVGKNITEDAMAASIILQDYLQTSQVSEVTA